MSNLLTAISSKERAKFFYSCFGFMCVTSAALLGRTVGDTLFLSRFGFDYLAYMYVGTALIVGSVLYFFGIMAGKMPLERLIVYTSLMLILVVLGLRIGLAFPWGGFSVAAYLVADLLVYYPMLLFWSFSALIFDPREAKRLFGYIGAAGTAACIIAGYSIRPLSASFGTANLFILISLLVAGFIFATVRLSQFKAGPSPADKSSGKAHVNTSNVSLMFKSDQIRTLAFLVLAGTVALILTDFQFKAVAQQEYIGTDLAGFFGTFYAAANVVALCIQLFLVHLIFQRGGLLFALRILPIGLFITSVITVITGTFGWIIASKFLIQIFAFTIDIIALQLLYLGVKKQSRSRARVFIDGLLKPGAIAVTGIAMIILSRVMPIHYLALGCAVVTSLWFIISKMSHTAYLTSLLESLGSKRFDMSQESVSIHDKEFENSVRNILMATPDDELPYILDLVYEMSQIDWAPEFRELLNRESAEAKKAAIQYLESKGNADDLSNIISYINHPDASVRAVTISAVCTLGEDETCETIIPYLEDHDLPVRIAAISGFMTRDNSDYLQKARKQLNALLESDNFEERIAAAQIFAQIPFDDNIQDFTNLLSDPNFSVRIAALHACKGRFHAQLIAPIFSQLAEKSTAAEAAKILVSFKNSVVENLNSTLESNIHTVSFEGVYYIPSILAKIGDSASLPVLSSACESSNIQLRSSAVKAYCKLIQNELSVTPYSEELKNAVLRENNTAEEQRNILGKAESPNHSHMLAEALREDYNSMLKNIFSYLDVLHPGVGIEAVYKNLIGGQNENRAKALEALDNLLEGEVKTRILKHLEASDKKSISMSDEEVNRFVTLLEAYDSALIKAGILYVIGKNKLKCSIKTVVDALDNRSTIIRETALLALGSIGDRELVLSTSNKLIDDSQPEIRNLAQQLKDTR